MTSFKIVVTAVLATLATLVFGIASIWALWPATAEAGVGIAQHSGGWHGGGWHRDRDNHCARFDQRHIRIGEAIITTGLDLDDSQQATLGVIATRMKTLSDDLRATCEATDLTSLDGSLLGVENALTMSAAALAEIRPLINDFYAGLNDEQRAVLQEHMQRHGRHKHHRHHRDSDET